MAKTKGCTFSRRELDILNDLAKEKIYSIADNPFAGTQLEEHDPTVKTYVKMGHEELVRLVGDMQIKMLEVAAYAAVKQTINKAIGTTSTDE